MDQTSKWKLVHDKRRLQVCLRCGYQCCLLIDEATVLVVEV